MKKTLLILSVAFLGLASCKKDYTCTCVSTTSNQSSSSTYHSSKAVAEDRCDGEQQVQDSFNPGAYSCVLSD